MNPGDLVRLTGVARLYVTLDHMASDSKNLNDPDRDVFGILLKKRTEEFTDEDIDNLGFGSHVWDVLAGGQIEKIWEIDLTVINKSLEDCNVLDLSSEKKDRRSWSMSSEKKDRNLRHLSRVVRILKDGRF